MRANWLRQGAFKVSAFYDFDAKFTMFCAPHELVFVEQFAQVIR